MFYYSVISLSAWLKGYSLPFRAARSVPLIIYFRPGAVTTDVNNGF